MSLSAEVPSAALEAAKLEALYQFAYGLSHEINNPLANIATRAQTLLVDEVDPERRRKLATIVQQAFRAHEMIADLMLFARPPALRVEAVDLVQVADTVVAEMQPVAQEQGTKLSRVSETPSLVAQVDCVQIAVALKALVQNALEALQQGGEVVVNVAKLEISVTDTGPGIPEAIRPHIFDPYFSGREAGRGLGLGLCKAWRITELHGGTVTVENRAGGGARFAISLAADRQQAPVV